MTWRQYLRNLELNQEWDAAVACLEAGIRAEPDYMDQYIYLNFLLMSILVNRQNKFEYDHYAHLLKHYFNVSYEKFCGNAEYLFCSGITLSRLPDYAKSYLAIDPAAVRSMLHKALELDPNNIVYQQTYYRQLDLAQPEQLAAAQVYANLVMQENSMLALELKSRGALGAYLYDDLRKWARGVL